MGLQILGIGPLSYPTGYRCQEWRRRPPKGSEALRNAPKAEVSLSGLLQKGKLFDLRDF